MEFQDEPKREFKGIWIPKEIWLDNSLSANEKVLYAEIDSFTSNDKACYISNEYIANLLSISKTNASKTLNSLIKKGYVVVEKFDGRRRYIRANQKGNDDKADLSKSTRQGCQERQDTNISTKDRKKENILKESEIVDFWNENTEDYPKVAKVSDKVKKAIKARINEGYTIEELKCAILLMNTLGDFYKGKGDSHWKADFLWLMSNTKGNFEKILAGGLHVSAIQKHQYEIVMASQGKFDESEYHPIYDDKSEIQFDKKENHYRLIGKDPRFSRVYDGYNDNTRPDGAILLTQYGKMKWSSESKEWEEIR